MPESQQVLRHNLNNVNASDFGKYAEAIKADKAFAFKSFLPTDEKCHFERYNFVHKDGKLGIVYDTKAGMVSISAKKSVLDAALSAMGLMAPAAKQPNEKKPAEKKTTGQTAKQPAAKKPKAQAAQKSVHKGADAAAVASELPEYKDGYSVKKCPQTRFDSFIKRIRAQKGVSIATETENGITVCRITDKSKQEKCILRYVVKKQTVQLQGKRSNLFAQVQVILSSGSGFNEAVGSHMALTGEQKRTGTAERKLRKLLPDAFELLSEQSRIDIGIGMVDIGNPEVKLSDYSVLLVPPYRGLERFIYDLQQARGISVKMIGQAYEKDDDGHHMLKAAYRKKNGIVYSEVMSALYTEYFEKRNFYAHSDNTDMGQSRMISDKASAEKIFNNLCEIIDYNAKKLKETGFTRAEDKN